MNGAPIEGQHAACPFCGGDKLELCDDSREGPLGTNTTPLVFWVRCAVWACRATGPRAGTVTTALLDWDKRK